MRPLDGDLSAAGCHRPLARVADGGMGRVLLATGPAGLVAVKVVRPELLDADGFRERFRKEVAAAREVGGPHVAAVIDADAEADVPWLATEFVLGPSLQDVLASGPLPEAAMLRLADGLARALIAVHAARLVHRDLKPANVGPRSSSNHRPRPSHLRPRRRWRPGLHSGGPSAVSRRPSSCSPP